MACFGFAGVANADTTSAGGINYTFTSLGSDGSGGFLVELSINATGATSTGTLNSFSVQFDGSTNVLIESTPTGTGTWVNEGKGTNTASGCNINGSANHWCIDGGAISVPSTGPASDGTYDFVFDVLGLGSAPTSSHIQAFQGTSLAISNDVGIGTSTPPSVPEPASIILLGFGLAGTPFLRRRK